MTELVDAGLYTSLKTTLVPTNGAGTPTFTRATTKNIFDNEGKLITVKSGAVTLGGARGVINWSSKSEDISGATYTVSGGGTRTATIFVCSNTTTLQSINDNSTGIATLVGQVWVTKCRVQYVDIQYVQLTGGGGTFGTGQHCNFDLINGDYTATGCTAAIDSVSAGVWDISITIIATAATTNAGTFLSLVGSQSAARFSAFTGDGVKSVGITRFQVENVTGQAIQTAGDYVSVGVLSAP